MQTMNPAQKIPATLIPGDGIGTEVSAATLEVLDAVGAPFAWETHEAGVAGLDKHKDPLPPQTIESIRRTRLALKHGRKKVTLVHKANVLKALTGLFLDTGREVAKQYEAKGISCDERIIDACAMQLVMNPWQFDVIVTTNLFGDILSDLNAGLVGGLGMAPGANIGPDAAIFEAVHGSAPDIAGKGIANPLALLLAVGLMLEHVDQPDLANRLRTAIDQVLRKDGVRTPDLGGKASTGDFTQSIIRRLGG